MTKSKYDFQGVATAYEVRCNDGRLIKKGAFDGQHGENVVLVWQHNHKDPRNYLGHGLLVKSDDPSGMKIVARFNGSKEGIHARQLVKDGTVKNLSIWANELIEHADGTGRTVESGIIREVSLVLAGQNPGAKIEDVIRHGDDDDPFSEMLDGVIIHTNYQIQTTTKSDSILDIEPTGGVEEVEEPTDDETVVEHAQDDGSVAEILASLNPAQNNLFGFMLSHAVSGVKPNDDNSKLKGGKSVKEVFDTLSEKQKTVLYFMIGQASQDKNLSQGEETTMTRHNIFEVETPESEAYIAHQAVNNTLNLAIQGRTEDLKAFFKGADEALAHSITTISNLFPDPTQYDTGGPMFDARRMSWVDRLMSAVSRRPFSRIKTWYADITQDEARAKGYVTGAQKVEEVIAVLKRTTVPTTVYKLQKLDRDDVVDITEFSVIAWLRGEMEMMLREEIARAILIGDGRSNASADKVNDTNIRPVLLDDPVYTLDYIYEPGANVLFADLTVDQTLTFIDSVAAAMDGYRGTGMPTMFISPEALNKMLLIRDADSHRLYRTMDELANELQVSDIVKVDVMSELVQVTTDIGGTNYEVLPIGVIFNPKDYVVGATKLGQTNFFDDFDLNFNKLEFLLETRISGALVKPKSALVVHIAEALTV